MVFWNSTIPQPAGILAKPSPLHGLGVFAEKSFTINDVIEKAPLILLKESDKELLEYTRLYHYYFVVDNPKTPAALGLGLSSLYNHSSAANACYRINVNKEYLEIIACKPVTPGEEITLNYNGRPNDPSPVYFPPADV